MSANHFNERVGAGKCVDIHRACGDYGMTFTVRFESHVLTMLGAVAVLAVVSTLAAGKLAIPYFAADRLILVSALTFGYGGILISLVFIASWSRIRSFINPATGQFDVAATLRAYRFPVLPALLMYAATIYGITAAGNLVELYRVQMPDVRWYDEMLWGLEHDFLKWLIASPLSVPRFWDAIYFGFWAVLTFTSGLLAAHRHSRCNAVFLLGIVVSYFLTRAIAIAFPTAGPLFYQPDLFHIAGTGSHATSQYLLAYMAGSVDQDGFLPGTMAMPSLHVGSTAMAAWALANVWKRSLWLMIPIVVLVWTSTIMLGWHYALDGVGGIVVAFVSVLIASSLITLAGRVEQQLGGITPAGLNQTG